VSYRSSRLLRRVLLAAPLVTIAFLPSPVLAATGLNPQLPFGISPNGNDLYNLYNLISIPALVVFFLVEALLLTIIIRDRRRRLGPGYRPPQWHSNRRLEIIWTVVPFLLLIGIGGLSFNELQRDFQPVAEPANMEISVTAFRFGWTYTYPQGFSITSNSDVSIQPLVVPTGSLVRLKLDSTDVIHSFWVPDISGKTDAVPGYDNYTWFKISQPGEWRGECAELCGPGHASMQVRVEAMSPGDFNIWAAEEQSRAAPTPTPSPAPSAPASPSPSPSASARPSPSPSS
jgi:cytochrome c oxidase subunit II